MKLAHIAPIKHIKRAQHASTIHMVLAHWLLDEQYFKLWKEFKEQNPNEYVIVDNGYYELGYSLNFNFCLERAASIKANCIVLSDGTLFQHEMIAAYQNNLEVMAVPTSVESFHSYMQSERVHKVGLGSIHVKRMLGIEDPKLGFHHMNRYNFLKAYMEESYNKEKIHLLGISDSIREIVLCRELVGSMDTSAAIWRGVNGVDVSEEGKYGVSLDIYSELPFNNQALENLLNMNLRARGIIK